MITAILPCRVDPVSSTNFCESGSVAMCVPAGANSWQWRSREDECLEVQGLSELESRERDQYEKTICIGWNTFLEVGRALSAIRQKRLYRDQYRTFDEYCRQKWDFSKSHANRLIEAAAVADVLTPIGVKVKKESHVRALVWLSPQQIVAAWRKAEQMAGKGEVTASLIRRAAAEFKNDCTPDPGFTPPKRNVLNRAALNVALKLIERAEQAAVKKDTEAVLEVLGDLRQRLLDCDNNQGDACLSEQDETSGSAFGHAG